MYGLRFSAASATSDGARKGLISTGSFCADHEVYDSDTLRQSLASRGAWANVKPMPRRLNGPPFSRFLYRLRNRIERSFNKFKHFRGVATPLREIRR